MSRANYNINKHNNLNILKNGVYLLLNTLKMETQFIDLSDLADIRNKLLIGDSEAVDNILHELDRLEMIIKDYELGIRLLNDKFLSKTGKRPLAR